MEPHDHERLARTLAERMGGNGEVTRLVAGMSSTAWTCRVGEAEYVIRIPVGDGLRPTPDYAAESRLLADLAARGAAVAVARILDVDGVECSLAPRIVGRPAGPDDWTADFVEGVAHTLGIVHETAADLAVEPDPVARFHLGRIWPLDGTSLIDHPVVRWRPDWCDRIESLRADIVDVAGGAHTVVHTDLHWQHLLVGEHGGFAGLLDFGDAFAGVAAWDHACLRYYHGADIARRVHDAMGARAPDPSSIDLLAVVFGLYKLSKTPDRADVREYVERLLNTSTTFDIP